MIPLKSGGKVYGAHLTAAERKAMNIEIQKAMAEYDRNNATEIDATVLWILHKEFGFGHDRLKKFHELFGTDLNALCERYELTDNSDELWLCTHKLKEDGIDIEQWNKEKYGEV